MLNMRFPCSFSSLSVRFAVEYICLLIFNTNFQLEFINNSLYTTFETICHHCEHYSGSRMHHPRFYFKNSIRIHKHLNKRSPLPQNTSVSLSTTNNLFMPSPLPTYHTSHFHFPFLIEKTALLGKLLFTGLSRTAEKLHITYFFSLGR